MFPSPSLGPPLLSASWSPPLFCGMPVVELAAPEPPCEAEADGADVDGDADGAGPEDEALPPYPPPQPEAAIAAAASRGTPAASKRDLRTVRFELLGWRSVA
jgi:hypothetical protein